MQVCQVSASSSLRFLGRKILNIFLKIKIKNITFVEGDVLSKYAKFHPLYGF